MDVGTLHPGSALWRAATELFEKTGLGGGPVLTPLLGGANNRVFKAVVGDNSILLKAYFQHPDDPRDRLGAEFSFSTFAWQNGLRCLPQPIARDATNHLGLYEYVEGRRLSPKEVTERVVEEALGFYQELNRHREQPDAVRLPNGSEACFSIGEHLRCVERRMERLLAIEGSSSIDRAADSFIRHDLASAWMDVVDRTRGHCRELGLPLDQEIPRKDRRLSPSDFGFHNAILPVDDRLRFIDFEYAGWDDPAKMVCDFFCQPAVPVPPEYFEPFTRSVASGLSDPDLHRARIETLLPLYQLKWCCILLNDFLSVGGHRRRYAESGLLEEDRKARQLRKAQEALHRLQSKR